MLGMRVVGVMLLLVALIGGRARAADISDAEIENKRCLNCHGQSQIAELGPKERLQMVSVQEAATEPATRPGLYTPADTIKHSVHANQSCITCHPDAKTLPHNARMKTPTCASSGCHKKEGGAFVQSSHAAATAKGDPNAPTCVTCHGAHDILPPSDRNSKTFPLNIVKVCAGCHEKHLGKTTDGRDGAKDVSSYLESVHGRGVSKSGLKDSATCASCHGAHDVRPSRDPKSAVHRDNIPETCGRCHVGVTELYAKSVHGELLAAGNTKAPVCSDCHTAHAISRTDVGDFARDIVGECGSCHDKPKAGSKEKASLYQTYRASFHGQANKLGFARAARCSDCHGAHDIRRINDAMSPLNAANKINTCRKSACHPGANANFASFAPHADFRNSTRYPLLHYVYLYFVIMMSAAFGFFGLHCILWAGRSMIERIKHGPHPKIDYSKGAIQRFNRVDRINHGLVIITFFGLAITGLPLLYSDKTWAHFLETILGGVYSCRMLHRIFAVMLIGNFVVHAVGVVRRFKKHGIFQMLLGPTTMLPTRKDLRDLLGMFRWFAVGGVKPKFDRWTYWEKFDYTAEVGGSVIIGVTGLFLWFPVFFSSYLPGWMFNVAMIVHGFEALLAVGFIFTIHFFNAHLRLEKFPVDDVMFTGRLPEEEFKHERGAEYDRVVASGEIAKLRVAAPPTWYRRFSVVLGIAAMVVGTSIVVLIILAALSLI